MNRYQVFISFIFFFHTTNAQESFRRGKLSFQYVIKTERLYELNALLISDLSPARVVYSGIRTGFQLTERCSGELYFYGGRVDDYRHTGFTLEHDYIAQKGMLIGYEFLRQPLNARWSLSLHAFSGYGGVVIPKISSQTFGQVRYGIAAELKMNRIWSIRQGGYYNFALNSSLPHSWSLESALVLRPPLEWYKS